MKNCKVVDLNLLISKLYFQAKTPVFTAAAFFYQSTCFFKKHLNASRPTEHPPVKGKKLQRLGGIIGCNCRMGSVVEVLAFFKISKYIWDPARGGVLEGGGPGGGLLCPSIRQ